MEPVSNEFFCLSRRSILSTDVFIPNLHKMGIGKSSEKLKLYRWLAMKI
jgi:hypothetical protein